MTGELIALDSAALYALSGVAIARCAAGDPERRGDNGVSEITKGPRTGPFLFHHPMDGIAIIML